MGTQRVSVEDYVAGVGTACPVCATESTSELFSYGSSEYDGAEVSQDVTCGRCGSSWLDVYVLSRYELLDVVGDHDDWHENPRHTRADWRQEVCSESTQRGYWDWVTAQTEQED